MTIYMVVSPDEYELPMLITESVSEIAEITGMDPSSIYKLLKHRGKSHVKYQGSYFKVKKTEIEEDENV